MTLANLVVDVEARLQRAIENLWKLMLAFSVELEKGNDLQRLCISCRLFGKWYKNAMNKLNRDFDGLRVVSAIRPWSVDQPLSTQSQIDC